MSFGFYEIGMLIISALLFFFFLWAAFVSKKENEPLAVNRFLGISVLILGLYLIAVLVADQGFMQISFYVLLVLILLASALLLPFGNKLSYKFEIPQSRIDERDTMFSRRELEPDSPEFEEYYKRKPENKVADDHFRTLPGLLSNTSSQYNAFNFASSNASFQTVDAFYNEVNAEVSTDITEVNPEEISTYLKAWSTKLGALELGITLLQDYHVYSHGGRMERRDKAYEKQHEFAIAFTVEMDKTMIDTAPKAGVVMESGQQYLEAGRIAIQIAKFIGNLGYKARAHIDGNYEVVCPLVARDAGLGEIGRMGLLMTPKHGPRVRIGVVTTNMPLQVDEAKPDFSVIDFCTICKKCADSCPSQAISFNDREMINGVNRWQINQEACFTLWCNLGTDCGRCVSVCPYSHEDNALHNLIRTGIKNNKVFRQFALQMDDVFYGRRPKSKEIPKALNI